jgi:hypothetical protein
MYKLTNETTVIRLADGAYIPADPANTDYRNFLDWMKAGGTPQAADPAPAAVKQPTVADLIAVLKTADPAFETKLDEVMKA